MDAHELIKICKRDNYWWHDAEEYPDEVPRHVLHLLNNTQININKKDHDGNTALMHCAKNGLIEILNILLANDKININLQNKSGKTALIQAAYSVGYNEGGRRLDIIQALTNHAKLELGFRDEQLEEAGERMVAAPDG